MRNPGPPTDLAEGDRGRLPRRERRERREQTPHQVRMCLMRTSLSLVGRRLSRPALLLILALCTAGCLTSTDRAGLSVTDAEDLKAKGRPVFGAPIALSQSRQVIVPFAVEHDDDGKFSAGFS